MSAGGFRHGTLGAAATMKGEAFFIGVPFLGLGDSNDTNTQLFDFSVDILQALLWQYNKAEAYTALLESKQTWVTANQEEFWENWFTNVFDIRTVNDFGAAVWSIILGIPLNIQYGETDGANWGFGPYQQNFDRGNFAPLNYEVIPLTIAQKRIVLQLRYYQLITRCVPPDINKNFARIFASLGPAYVIDNLNMTMTYVFNFQIPSALEFILRFYNLLPQPNGVSVSYQQNGSAAATMVGVAVMKAANGHSVMHAVGAASMVGSS